MSKSRALFSVCWVYASLIGFGNAAEPLLVVGQPLVEAEFLGTTDTGNLRFQVDGQPQQVTAERLVRWSSPGKSYPASKILLADGSRLALAESWTGRPSWQLAETTITVATKQFGKVTLPRDKLRAIVLNLPNDLRRRSKFYDLLQSSLQVTDQIHLANGDQLAGKFLGLTTSDKKQLIDFQVGAASRPLQFPLARVTAIAFAHEERTSDEAKLIVGMRGGSKLKATSFVADVKLLRVTLTSGTELTGADPSEVLYLRSLGTECRYLSDLKPADYRHVPYLEIPWPYRLDRNVLGGRLLASGRIYSKGIGMMTASRLTYRIDGSEVKNRFSRFVATVAVDDEAAGGGSVIFRVYLQLDSRWQLAYTSPVVRGGDDPAAVSVELEGATQLMLVSDFADRGDERDYASWLDARLE